MLSSPVAMNFMGMMQHGVSRLQQNVHQQLHHLMVSVPSEATPSCRLHSAFVCNGSIINTQAKTNMNTGHMLMHPRVNGDSSDLLLTALEGVSLNIASYLDGDTLCQVQAVNRSWRQFILANREVLFGALLNTSFTTVIRSSTMYKSYLFSLRNELDRELMHTQGIQPLHTALEHYCTVIEPKNHGFIAMFCDIVEFKNPVFARFVADRRQHALSMVLVATPDHVSEFRKRSNYVGPITFVPVDNPNWPEFESPSVDFQGFLGYAFDHINMVKGYESLKDTVVKSILKELMLFDTRENAAAYGLTVHSTPYVAVVDESTHNAWNMLTFSTPLRRKLSHYPVQERVRKLQDRIKAVDNCISNYAS